MIYVLIKSLHQRLVSHKSSSVLDQF